MNTIDAIDAIDTLVQLGTSAMTLLGQLADVPAERVIARGAEHDTVRAYYKLADVYYGPCGSPKQQRLSREAATKNRHGMDRLKHIENYVARVDKNKDKWPLRRTLVEFVGHTNDFRRYARQQLAALEQPATDTPTRDYHVTKHAGSTDATLSVRGTQAEITEIDARIREYAETHDASVAEAAVAVMNTGGGEVIYGAKILIPYDVGMAMLDGEGDDALLSTTLATTLGATVTGHEAMRMKLGPIAEFVGLTNVDGPVSLSTGRLTGNDEPITTREALERLREAAQSGLGKAHNTRHEHSPEALKVAFQRSPTAKQRALLEAAQIVCGEEGCSVPAYRCEANHNVAYSRGGLTVLRNLSLLCPYHNGKAGAEERYRNIRGEVHRILPGGRMVRNEHPVAQRNPIRTLFETGFRSGP
ncbi:HNH endonuclease signature motif containing protein [Corynebacterium cystitidis]|uniref:HNH nuclease domain-containing protein n=1 Tax=Corynebacterium cystitidis DSM 20524 TaxID=1121357 RepID=A0A1H9PP69_9CORY|nr:HNH endonuclease [Corynebacterium cystitidis]WJY82429.1 hypothetical protein CCYS_07525 [Corynebacterium cystitidis DSM 20524]SER49947.1 hypothetical protein SAMN05661109_00413 [Corynebacterium cystitidis DSM 20524]SNV75715.1 Endonuclease [Corynebacterium cystitidis]